MVEGNGVAVRLNRLESDIRDLQGEIRDYGALRERVTHLTREVHELSDEVRGMRRVMVGLLATIAGSTVIFALSVLAATGKIG